MTIESGSHVTLHYRLAVLLEGEEREIVSTLGGHPATLQVGAGQLAPALEQRLIGLPEGARATFDLACDQAYGPRNPELVRSVARAAFDRSADSAADHGAGDIVRFNVPDGGRFAGVLKELGSERVVVDFNHPLAGLPVRFSVQVIGVL